MNRAFVSLLLLALAAIGGCDPPEIVPASGKVTQGGTAVAEATVMLHYPTGDLAVASTDDQGAFSLTMNGQNGARPGKQIGVTVTKRQSAANAAKSSDPLPDGPPPENTPTKTPMGKGPDTSVNVLPVEYGDPKNPKIKVDIPEEGTDKLEIKLP